MKGKKIPLMIIAGIDSKTLCNKINCFFFFSLPMISNPVLTCHSVFFCFSHLLSLVLIRKKAQRAKSMGEKRLFHASGPLQEEKLFLFQK